MSEEVHPIQTRRHCHRLDRVYQWNPEPPLTARYNLGPLDQQPAKKRTDPHKHAAFGCLRSYR